MEMSIGGCQKRTENRRLAFAAPRGHAKSTIVTLVLCDVVDLL
jgi:hypothetical protein